MAGKKEAELGKAVQACVSLSVAFVFIILGVPLWWKTTEVYRVSLPYGEIQALADQQTMYAVHIKIIFFDMNVEKSIMAGLQENLNLALNQDSRPSALLAPKYNVFARYAADGEQAVFHNSTTVEGLDSDLSRVGDDRQAEEYYFFVLPGHKSLDCKEGIIGQRAGIFLTIKDYESVVPVMKNLVQNIFVREESIARAYHVATGVTLDQTDRDSMRILKSEPAYDVTLTLLNSRPDLMDVRWDVADALEEYLRPFLDTMSPYVQFDIKSQVLHYVDLPMQPEFDKNLSQHYYNYDDLPRLILPIEREMVSFTSNKPHINFVVYAVREDFTPIHIRDKTGNKAAVNAFLSPRWGGMMFYNMPKVENITQYPVKRQIEMKEIMQLLVTQLRLLIGVESSMPELPIRESEKDERAIAFWELSYWLRKRTLESSGVATAALNSLSQLLAKISNIVIRDEIGEEIRVAVDAVHKTRVSLLRCHLVQGFTAARQALLSAEKAFFDQSLLELLYFPDDQKFAIYIPLFLPVSLPVLMSMVTALKWLFGKDKQKDKKS